MFPSRRLALSLLPCALLATACTPSAFPIKRDPPPAELTRVPERPQLAPEGATDNELGEERTRFGVAYIKLEGQLQRLICYVIECKPPPSPTK